MEIGKKFNIETYIGFNRISLALLIIMIASLLIGCVLLFNGALTGIIFLLLGGWICTGWDQPTPSPKKVWLITLFGQKTTVRSYGLTLLFKPMIDKVEFVLEQVDHDFPIKKPIICTHRDKTSSDKDVQIEGYLTGIVSTSILPDDQDDTDMSIPQGDRKSGGQKLRDFDNAGKIDGVKKQLDDVLTSLIQTLADNKGVDMIWMETNSPKISEIMLLCLQGKAIGPELRRINPLIVGDLDTSSIAKSHLHNARGLGVKFTKFQVLLSPSDTKVIDARNRLAIEVGQRTAQLQNTLTMNEKIAHRAVVYGLGSINSDGKPVMNPRIPIEKLQELRAEVLQEDLVDDGKATLAMNKGGITIVDTR